MDHIRFMPLQHLTSWSLFLALSFTDLCQATLYLNLWFILLDFFLGLFFFHPPLNTGVSLSFSSRISQWCANRSPTQGIAHHLDAHISKAVSLVPVVLLRSEPVVEKAFPNSNMQMNFSRNLASPYPPCTQLALVKGTTIHSGTWDRILRAIKLSSVPSSYLPYIFLFLRHLLCHCLNSELHHLLPRWLRGLLTHFPVSSYHFHQYERNPSQAKILSSHDSCFKSCGFPHPQDQAQTSLYGKYSRCTTL